MVRLLYWQWVVLAAPIAGMLVFVLGAAAYQVHEWHLSWIWAVIGLGFVGWRWLLVRWTRPALAEVEEIVAELAAEFPDQRPPTGSAAAGGTKVQQAEAALRQILGESREDPPMWTDWNIFWRRALALISAIAQVYNPRAKQPLLNIYIPQAYVLLRGTVDDLNEWMQKLAPVLNQVTIEQALQAYQVYQKVQPAARRVLQVWGWAQWLLNPVAAAARTATQGSRTKATQELLGNFNQVAREAVLRNLARQAILLYGGGGNNLPLLPEGVAVGGGSPATGGLNPETQSIRELLSAASPIAVIATQPVNLMLIGRTGAGKSSLINSLFTQPVAAVDALPSTDRLQDYHWRVTDRLDAREAPAELGRGESGRGESASGESASGESASEAMVLWDTPGYEQVGRADFRAMVIDRARSVDLVLLVLPALDPALQMDIDVLQDLQAAVPGLPTIAVVTQVDRLRPWKEWQPPYDWRNGERPKEVNIRAAIDYRTALLPSIATMLPVVTGDPVTGDQGRWGLDAVVRAILDGLEPAKQQRLARCLRDLDGRTDAAVRLIDRYIWQMATQQGITVFLKSPVLRFISTLATGSPTLAILLAERIPVEQLPLVIGKAQLAYDLYNLLAPNMGFDLLLLWRLLTDPRGEPDRNVRAFGQTLLAYWLQSIGPEDLVTRFEQVLLADGN
jgi:uncharacterized protein